MGSLTREISGLLDDDDVNEIKFEDLVLIEQIGKGSFGRVWKGKYLGTDVAVKQIFRETNQEKELQQYIDREINISKMRHPHLVQLIGVCSQPNCIYLVTELITGGDLWKHLKDHKFEMNWGLRTRVAMDLAKALTFLHSKNVIHRDIKSKNCLVDSAWKIKLCDFGFSRKVSRENRPMTICGTDDWMAPELILGMPYDEKVDVYSYGIVLCEIITRKKIEKEFHREPQDAFSLNVDHLKKQVEKDCPSDLLQLTIDCCKWDAHLRPSFKDVLDKLSDVYEKVGVEDRQHIQESLSSAHLTVKSETDSRIAQSAKGGPMKWAKPMGGYAPKFEPRIDPRNLKAIQLEGHMDLEKALHCVCSPTSYSGWVLVGYVNDKTVKLQGYGTGGIAELEKQLKDNEVQYAIVRTQLEAEGARKTRDVCMAWYGPKVSNLQKGIKKTHDSDVKNLFRPFHADLQVTNRQHFTQEEFMKKSNPLSGSHQID